MVLFPIAVLPDFQLRKRRYPATMPLLENFPSCCHSEFDSANMFDWPWLTVMKRPRVERVQVEKKWIQKLDCSDFTPDEITVKVENGKMHVQARREESDDSNRTEYCLRRVLTIPADVITDEVRSYLQDDGTLVIEAPKNQSISGCRRVVSKRQIDAGKSAGSQKSQTERRGGDAKGENVDQDKDTPSHISVESFEATDTDACQLKDTDGTGIFTTGASGEKLSLDPKTKTGTSECADKVVNKDEKKTLTFNFDLKNCSSEDVEVRVRGNQLIVTSVRQRKGREFTLSERFYRMVTLPENADFSGLRSILRNDGTLTITAPVPKAVKETASERVIPVLSEEEEEEEKEDHQQRDACTSSEKIEENATCTSQKEDEEKIVTAESPKESEESAQEEMDPLSKQEGDTGKTGGEMDSEQ